MYSGIHYDAVALGEQVVFEGEELKRAEIQVMEVAKELKKNRKYTDLGSFTLKCAICAKGLVGQKDAQQHAIQTGHAQFTEY
jgi:ubiquitin thioesterase OTU1